MTLALVAGRGERSDVSPHLLASLSSLADGRFPETWSTEQRGQAVARKAIQPLAAAPPAAIGRRRRGGDDDSRGKRTPNGQILVPEELAQEEARSE